MAITVKSINLWRQEVSDNPGALASTLKPLADAGAHLHVVMGYRIPGSTGKSVIEVYPVAGKKPTAAALSVGLKASTIPALLVQGDDRAGLGHAMAEAIAGAGINIEFLVAQVIGHKYSAIWGFATQADADKAAALIKKSVSSKKK